MGGMSLQRELFQSVASFANLIKKFQLTRTNETFLNLYLLICRKFAQNCKLESIQLKSNFVFVDKFHFNRRCHIIWILIFFSKLTLLLPLFEIHSNIPKTPHDIFFLQNSFCSIKPFPLSSPHHPQSKHIMYFGMVVRRGTGKYSQGGTLMSPDELKYAHQKTNSPKHTHTINCCRSILTFLARDTV